MVKIQGLLNLSLSVKSFYFFNHFFFLPIFLGSYTKHILQNIYISIFSIYFESSVFVSFPLGCVGLSSGLQDANNPILSYCIFSFLLCDENVNFCVHFEACSQISSVNSLFFLQKIDYITYLATFDQLYNIPKERKNTSYKE